MRLAHLSNTIPASSIVFALAFLAGLFLSTNSPVQADTCSFTTDTTINDGDATCDGQNVVVNGCTLTVNGQHAFHSLQVVNNGTVTHSPAFTNGTTSGLHLTIAQDVTIDATSRLDVAAKGHDRQDTACSGLSDYYGWSSGGAMVEKEGIPCTGGRRSVRLRHRANRPRVRRRQLQRRDSERRARGRCRSSDGKRNALRTWSTDSQRSRWGVGGLCWRWRLRRQRLPHRRDAGGRWHDNGQRWRRGDPAYSGGGGGGRIAIYYDDAESFTGSFSACGGGGYERGGAGTIFLKKSSEAAAVALIHNCGPSGAATRWLCQNDRPYD